MINHYSVDDLIRRCMTVLANRPAALVTDIDGTISLIAPSPDAAVVSGDARNALARLATILDVVATVSGRAAANAEAMVGVPGLLYIGNHGMERRTAGATTIHPEVAFATGAVAEALAVVQQKARARGIVEGILYENKGVTGSVHYRLAPDQNAARAGLLSVIQAEAKTRGLRVTEGRMVIELRPVVAIDKGSAVRSIAEEHGLRGLVFLGDDVTDIDAFRAIADLRDSGRLDGLTIAVVAEESLPEVAEAADVVVHGVESCVALLGGLADELTSEADV